MSKKIVYFMGHPLLGDVFCFCAAANWYGERFKKEILVSFKGDFDFLLKIFPHIKLIKHDINSEEYEYIDTGVDPGLLWFRFNCFTRFLYYIDIDKDIDRDILKNIEFKISKKEREKEFATISLNGNTNRFLSPKVFDKMLSFAKNKYNFNTIAIIGHPSHIELEPYKKVAFNHKVELIDKREHDKTIDIIKKHLEKSIVHFSLHTSTVYISISLGVPCIVERSTMSNYEHDHCPRIKNADITFFDREDVIKESPQKILWDRYGTDKYPTEWDGNVFGGGKISQRFWEYLQSINLTKINKDSEVLILNQNGDNFLYEILKYSTKRVVKINPYSDIDFFLEHLKIAIDENRFSTIISIATIDTLFLEHKEICTESLKIIDNDFKGDNFVFTSEYHPSVRNINKQLINSDLSEICSIFKNMHVSKIESASIINEHAVDSEKNVLWKPISILFKRE